MAPSKKVLMSKKEKRKAVSAEDIALRIKATQLKKSATSGAAREVMSDAQKNAADIARRIKAVRDMNRAAQDMNRAAASSSAGTTSSGKNATSSPVDVPLEKNASPSDTAVSAPKKVRYSRKAKSTSVPKKPKSKKTKEHVEDPNITGGLRLLSRPMVTMANVTKRVIRGIKLPIDCDDRGTPIGKNAAELQSYLGVLARTTIPIIFDDWRNVDDEPKQKIWEAIEEAYVIPKECRKNVLKSAASKWREFKSCLTTNYIIPYKDTPEMFENPPDDYRCIPKLHWSLFVEDRISDEFQELREVQKGKRAQNKYNHRLSRKGYAQSRVELAKKLGVPIEMLDRATMWIAAHTDKEGNFTSPEVEKTAKKIEKLKKKESEGSLTTEGSTDVLTIALKKPEHPGRVRGVGGFVRPDVVFDLPKKRKRGDASQQTRKSVRLIMEEEYEEMLAAERAEWKAETDRKLQQQNEFWTTKFTQLAADLKGAGVQIPTPLTPVNELNSGHGSCNPTHPKDNVVIDGEPNIVKKRLDLGGEELPLVEKDKNGASDLSQKVTAPDLDDIIDTLPPKLSTNILDLTCGDNECQLAVNTVDNIVAIAQVVMVNVESSVQLIHGAPLGENNVRVTVIRAIVGDALVPIPVRDEILTVNDAVGSCVAWPKELVVNPGAKAASAAVEMKKPKRSYTRKKPIIHIDDDVIDLEHLPPYLPFELNELCKWANTFLVKGRTINTVFSPGLFGRPKKALINRSDVYAVANMGEVSNMVILFYMSYLQEVLRKNKMEDMMQFVDCDLVSAIGSGTPTARARDLSCMYKNARPGQLFLIPYNTGKHWTLTIVNPLKETARYMDPLKRRLDGGEWPSIVSDSIKMYKGLKKIGKKKADPWKPLLGAPMQKDQKSCGYYVMRYMKDIVEDNNLDLDEKWGTRAGNPTSYTTQELDEVRDEWAKHVLSYPDN